MFKRFFTKILRCLVRWLLPFRIPERVVLLPEVLEDIRALASDAYPNEFVAFLHGTVVKRGEEHVAFVDGLQVIAYNASHVSTSFNLYSLPTLHDTVGTIHSHPSSNVHWSRADLRLFGKFGWVHGIIGRPYQARNLVFYDKNGNDFPWDSTS